MGEEMQVNRKAVADLISDRLRVLGETQKWLAQRAGMSESSLSDILKRKQDITVQQANRLAGVQELGLTATVILATAANADPTDEQRLIEDFGLIGSLYQRLSREKKEQVQDLISVLYQKESRDAARRTTDDEAQGRKPKSKK